MHLSKTKKPKISNFFVVFTTRWEMLLKTDEPLQFIDKIGIGLYIMLHTLHGRIPELKILLIRKRIGE
jgi:hypothetical protein